MPALRRAGVGLLVVFAAPAVSTIGFGCGDDDDGPRGAGAAGAAASAGAQGAAGGEGGSGGGAGEGTAGAGAGGATGAGGAAGAAGEAFRCGLSSSKCDVARQYCLTVFTELSEPSARCVDLPLECSAAPTCECLTADARTEDATCVVSASCSEQPLGEGHAFTMACRGSP